MRIDLLRHGPKNNDPEAHGTGIEALLSSEGLEQIRDYAVMIAESTERSRYPVIQIITTPVPRAIATGQVVYEVLSQKHKFDVQPPVIDDLLGSVVQKEGCQELVNLSPRSMSALWQQHKSEAEVAEHASLFAWFSQGLDNPQAWHPNYPERGRPDDPGISLREIAWRVGAFLHNIMETDDGFTRYLAFGHSGDLETWLALTWLMNQGTDTGLGGATVENMKSLFGLIGGALGPLAGYSMHSRYKDRFAIFGKPRLFPCCEYIFIPKQIIAEQAAIHRDLNQTNRILLNKAAEANYQRVTAMKQAQTDQ